MCIMHYACHASVSLEANCCVGSGLHCFILVTGLPTAHGNIHVSSSPMFFLVLVNNECVNLGWVL